MRSIYEAAEVHVCLLKGADVVIVKIEKCLLSISVVRRLGC